MISDNCLRNYIVKRLVSKVHIDKSTLTLIEDKTELTDSLLHELINECSKYGLNESAARSLITQIAGNVNCNPSVKTERYSLNVDNIVVGEHLKLNFVVESIGCIYLDLICIERNSFLIIDTSVPGTRIMDILISKNKLLNIGYDLQFCVKRNGKRYPDKEKYLQIGKFDSADRFEKSYLHYLFDSDEDYSYASIQDKSRREGYQYFDSVIQEEDKLVFKSNEESYIPKVSLYVIEPNKSNKSSAMLLINGDFIRRSMKTRNYEFVDNLNLCVDISGKSLTVEDFEWMKNIKYVEPAFLKKEGKDWMIISKPLIRIIK